MYFPHLLALVLAGVVYASRHLSPSLDVYYMLKSDLAVKHPEMSAPAVPTGEFPDVWMKLRASCLAYRNLTYRQNCLKCIWMPFIVAKAYETIKQTKIELQFFEGESALYHRNYDLINYLLGPEIFKTIFSQLPDREELGEFNNTTDKATQTIQTILSEMQKTYQSIASPRKSSRSSSKSLSNQGTPSKSSHASPSKSSHASPSKSSHASPSKHSSVHHTPRSSPTKVQSTMSPSKGNPFLQSPSERNSESQQASVSRSKVSISHATPIILSPDRGQRSIGRKSDSMTSPVRKSEMVCRDNRDEAAPRRIVSRKLFASSDSVSSEEEVKFEGSSAPRMPSVKPEESQTASTEPAQKQPASGRRSNSGNNSTSSPRNVSTSSPRNVSTSSPRNNSTSSPRNVSTSSPSKNSPSRRGSRAPRKATIADNFWDIQDQFYNVAHAVFELVDEWCATYKSSSEASNPSIEFWRVEFGSLQTLLNDAFSVVDLSNFGNLPSEEMLKRLNEFQDRLGSAVEREAPVLPPNVRKFIKTLLGTLEISELLHTSGGQLLKPAELLFAFMKSPYVHLVSVNISGWSNLFWKLATAPNTLPKRPMECLQIIGKAVESKSPEQLMEGFHCFGALAHDIKQVERH